MPFDWRALQKAADMYPYSVFLLCAYKCKTLLHTNALVDFEELKHIKAYSTRIKSLPPVFLSRFNERMDMNKAKLEKSIKLLGEVLWVWSGRWSEEHTSTRSPNLCFQDGLSNLLISVACLGFSSLVCCEQACWRRTACYLWKFKSPSMSVKVCLPQKGGRKKKSHFHATPQQKSFP